MDRINVLLLTRYERLGASSRVRFLQFLPELERQGFDFDIQPILRKDEVPLCRIGGGGEPSRLGWNTWLRSQPLPHDARDAVFCHEGWSSR